MGWINCTCSIIFAPPRPFLPFLSSHMDDMDSPLRLYRQHRDLMWAEQQLIGLPLCAELHWSPAHSLWQPAHPQIPYSCKYFVVSKSFFILPRRLVIQDLSNKITTVYFSLCGTMERGSELSCNVLTWVNVECLKLWGQTAWKELVCQAERQRKISVWEIISAWAFTPFDDLLLGLYWWLCYCFWMQFTIYPSYALRCVFSMLHQVFQSRVVLSALAPVLRSLFLGNRHTHQEALVFTVTGRPSTERLSLAELSHCLRQWSGIFTNRLRHCAICAGHLLLALLLIYVLLSWLKSKASHPRLRAVSLCSSAGEQTDGLKVMWTDVLAGAIKMPNDVTFLFADGRSADVRRRARGGGGSAAIAADHRQLSAV